MPVYKSSTETKDGRCWFFKTPYSYMNDTETKIMTSKKFLTRADAMKAERDFLITIAEQKEVPRDMKFSELYEKFLEFKKERVKYTTFQTYIYNAKHCQCFMKVKCVNYNISQFEAWKKKLAKNKKICTCQKNHIYKFWKSLLNYGTTWYGFDFSATYRKMTNFSDPHEKKKEMKFYTLEEFTTYLTAEKDLRYRCLWETLFFCGLRCGEARGLTWDSIDFKNKTLTVSKQVTDAPVGSNKKYEILPPKTRTSYRTIPICEVLLEDLKKYHDKISKLSDYNDHKFFVLGEDDGRIPFEPNTVRLRKLKNANAVGIKVIRTHDFRHSCASLLINNGANVTTVAKYLGHSEIEETLNTYSHMFPSALDNVLKIINNLDKGAEKL